MTNQPLATAPKADCTEFVAPATEHILSAMRITDVDDLRYFTMRDLQLIRVNLHLALELLEIVKRK